MEEDIKKIEKFIEDIKGCGLYDCAYNKDLRCKPIENLIKGYRELEEKLDNSRKANELLNKTNNELRLEIRTTYSKVVNDIISKFNLGDDYIPKSKVKEKIEELKELIIETQKELGSASKEFTIYVYQEKILQEFMEDK